MNKIVMITCFALFTINGFGCVQSYFSIQQELIENSHNYELYSSTSSDGKYTLETKESDEETGVYVTFSIKDNYDKTVVFECEEKYRTLDLKSIDWDGNNIIVKSSDVGTITYYFFDGQWSQEFIEYSSD
jgi:hypothetical protein